MKRIWAFVKEAATLIAGAILAVIALSFFAIAGTITFIISLFRKKDK